MSSSSSFAATTKGNRSSWMWGLWSLAVLAGTTQAFRPSPFVTNPVRTSTRLNVMGGKWQLPFGPSSSETTSPSQKDTKKKTSPFQLNESNTKTTTELEKSSSSLTSGNNLPPAFLSFFQQDTVEETQESMGDLVDMLTPEAVNGNSVVDNSSNNLAAPVLGAVAVALVVVGASVAGIVPTNDITGMVANFFQDPTSSLEQVTDLVASMGPWGPLYFGFLYTIAEVLAIPAVPLTASAGYLFGVSTGTLVVLISASIAASISFVIGRTLLRTTVEQAMTNYPQFAKLDKAIGREGFKLMLLLRLSPLFPFALSNYLYGATSIDFASFFWGTLLGFAPGTLAYVYTGVVGKALTLGADEAQPWYIYAAGAVLLGGLIKVLVDVAGNIVAEIEEQEEGQQA